MEINENNSFDFLQVEISLDDADIAKGGVTSFYDLVPENEFD